MSAPPDRRFVGTVLLAGAVLGVGSNALHPIFPPGVSTVALLQGVESSPTWLLVHLTLGVAVVVSAVGLRLLAQLLADTPGRTWAAVASGLATITGAIFAAQLVGVDGLVLPTLAAQLADGGGDAVLRSAEAWIAFDFALLSVGVMGFLGATYAALGYALLRAEAFSPWIRWAAIVVGGAGTVTGVLMYLAIADAVTLYAFRLVGLAATGVGLAIGLQLHRSKQVPSTTSSTAAR